MVYCRADARSLFVDSLPRLHTTMGLVDAATAMALHETPDIEPDSVRREISALAAIVRERVVSGSRHARIAHAHHLLFDELGYATIPHHEVEPKHGYLPEVLSNRRGLPVVLALIYKAVLEDLDITVEGINAPGHFLTRVALDLKPTWIDAAHGGRILTDAEAVQIVRERTYPRDARRDPTLPVASHANWTLRMLRNLQTLHAGRGQDRRCMAMQELEWLLRHGLSQTQSFRS